MLVKELLDSRYVTLNPTESIADAWQAMSNAGITGAAVVTEKGEVVGFLTDGDLIRACMPSESDITIYDEIMENMDLPAPLLRQLRTMRVEHAMQAEDDIVTIDQSEPVLKALALMYQHRLRRVPVLDGNKLIGTISRGRILTELLLERDLKRAKSADR
jgi:DHA2 family lincomycin resistance protein-like MFS transporter